MAIRSSTVGTSLHEVDEEGRGWVATSRVSSVLRDVALCGFLGTNTLKQLNDHITTRERRATGIRQVIL
jgi:hypothetical protein